MSDLLIKGLDLPKDGDYDYNLTIRSDGKVEGWQQVGERIVQIHSWAVEVKPHGRLIDADLAIKNLDKYYCNDCDNWNGVKCKTCEHYWAMPILEDAPTILEAST